MIEAAIKVFDTDGNKKLDKKEFQEVSCLAGFARHVGGFMVRGGTKRGWAEPP